MPAGRPTSFQPEFAVQAEKLCRLGATDAELAHFFEVDEATINRWKHVQPDFRASLKRAKRKPMAMLLMRYIVARLATNTTGSITRPIRRAAYSG